MRHVVILISLISSFAVASPTANEDFVIAEAAKAYTNAVEAAKKLGGGGDYVALTNKPKINGITIEGSKWSRDYGLADYQNLQNVQDSLDQHLGNFEEFLGYVDSELATREELSTMQQTQVTPLQDQVNSLGDHYNELSGTVSAWQAYWAGDDVRVTVTNYYGNLDIPSLYLEQKMPADETHDSAWFRTVWDERTRWNEFLSAYAAVTNDVVQNKADRAWGVYDSVSGEISPDGLLQLSQEQIMIASGMAYQKTVTAGGAAVWVLKSTSPTMLTGQNENGFFRIEDGDGNALFEIVKGDKRIVGATATSINAGSEGVTILYNCVSSEHPTLEWCRDLKAASWKTVGAGGGGGASLGQAAPPDTPSVSWSGESGAWRAEVTFVMTPPAAFFKATYEAGGNTYIRNNVATSIDKVVVGGIEYEVTVETVNGKKLLVLK